MSEQINLQEKLKEINETTHEDQNVVEVDGEKAYLQEIPNITDHRTFGEIQSDEQAQRNHVFDSLNDHRFDTKIQSSRFLDKAIIHAAKNLGVMFTEECMGGRLFADVILSNKDAANTLFLQNRVRMSRHRRSQVDEPWQAGLYIYKDKELAYFVSQPLKVQSETILSVPFWIVRTNIILPGGKGTIH